MPSRARRFFTAGRLLAPGEALPFLLRLLPPGLHILGVGLPVPQRRDALLLFEHLSEVALVLEAHQLGDARQADIFLPQQLLAAVDADAVEIEIGRAHV